MTKRQDTPQLLAKMIELLPAVGSLRELAKLLDLNDATVRKHASPLIAIMRAQRALPNCACGQERFHRYCCAATAKKPDWEEGVIVGKTRMESAIYAARRELIIAEILTGAPYSHIERKLGLRPKVARWVLRSMTPEQRQLRKELERQRLPKSKTKEPA